MPRYDVYLLRVWHDAPGEGQRWAARLEQVPGSGELRFGTLGDLLAHLARTLAVDGIEQPALQDSEVTGERRGAMDHD